MALTLQILNRLFDLGHFRNPENRSGDSWNVRREDLAKLTLVSKSVIEAVRSFQHFAMQQLESLAFVHHARRAIADGDFGPATEELVNLPRCNNPDYAIEESSEFFEEAIGRGSWPAGCLSNWPKNHAITVNVNKSGMRSFLEPHFDKQIWPAVVNAFADVGILLVREDGNQNANLHSQFVRPDGNWLGLAIVPGRTSCSLKIWNRYAQDWKPSNIAAMWTTLFLHELGHNLNLNHSNGGIMNPFLLSGLPASWKGDVSEPILNRYFGGERVPTPRDGPAVWTHQGLKDENTGEELWIPLHPPLPR